MPRRPPRGTRRGISLRCCRRAGLYPQRDSTRADGLGSHQHLPPQTQATTILAFKFAEGVLVAGDRRATAGNTVVYDRADKVLEIDRHSVMAIAGVSRRPPGKWRVCWSTRSNFTGARSCRR